MAVTHSHGTGDIGQDITENAVVGCLKDIRTKPFLPGVQGGGHKTG